MTPIDTGTDVSSVAQVILGLATLVNSLLLWPVIKKLQHNDRIQDAEIATLKKRKRVRR